MKKLSTGLLLGLGLMACYPATYGQGFRWFSNDPLKQHVCKKRETCSVTLTVTTKQEGTEITCSVTVDIPVMVVEKGYQNARLSWTLVTPTGHENDYRFHPRKGIDIETQGNDEFSVPIGSGDPDTGLSSSQTFVWVSRNKLKRAYLYNINVQHKKSDGKGYEPCEEADPIVINQG